MMMGFLSNNIAPGHKQTAALRQVNNKEVQISGLMQVISYFLLQYNTLQRRFSTLQQSKQETWEECKHFPTQGITLFNSDSFLIGLDIKLQIEEL